MEEAIQDIMEGIMIRQREVMLEQQVVLVVHVLLPENLMEVIAEDIMTLQEIM